MGLEDRVAAVREALEALVDLVVLAETLADHHQSWRPSTRTMTMSFPRKRSRMRQPHCWCWTRMAMEN